MSRPDNRGGRRNGAGRKPSDYSLSRRDDSLATSGARALEQLAGPIQVAIRRHVRGWSNAAIAREMGKSRETIAKWIADHPAAIEEAVRELVDPGELLRQHVPAATRAYGELLDHADRDATRLAAADSVFDRLYGKPVVREQRSERREVRIVFVDAADDGSVPGVVEGQAREIGQ